MNGGVDEHENTSVTELNRTFMIGEVSGLEQAAAHVRTIACEYFARAKDTEARAMREVAAALEEQAQAKRAKAGKP